MSFFVSQGSFSCVRPSSFLLSRAFSDKDFPALTSELPKVDVQRGDVIEIEPTCKPSRSSSVCWPSRSPIDLAYGIVSRTHHFYDDPHIKRLPKSDAYIYGSPARAPDFPKGEPSSWNKRHPQPDPELEESDFPVGKAPHES